MSVAICYINCSDLLFVLSHKIWLGDEVLAATVKKVS